jgi:glycerol-3-phosphate cytidylyltransferase
MGRDKRSEISQSPLDVRFERALLDNSHHSGMRRVITYGTFDLLHYGHINLLKRAKALGDYLIVVLSTDEFNWEQKHKKCYFSYEERKQLLEAIRYVDLVIPEESWEQKKSDVKEYHVDTFVMGDDWKGKFDFLKEEGVDVVYLPRTPEISTTSIKEDLHK